MTFAEFGSKPLEMVLALSTGITGQANGQHVIRCSTWATRGDKRNEVLHTQLGVFEKTLLVPTVGATTLPVGKRGLPMVCGESGGQGKLTGAPSLCMGIRYIWTRLIAKELPTALFVLIALLPCLARSKPALFVFLIPLFAKCTFVLLVSFGVFVQVFGVFADPFLMIGGRATSTIGSVSRLAFLALLKLRKRKNLLAPAASFVASGGKIVTFYLCWIGVALGTFVTTLDVAPAVAVIVTIALVMAGNKGEWLTFDHAFTSSVSSGNRGFSSTTALAITKGDVLSRVTHSVSLSLVSRCFGMASGGARTAFWELP